MNFSKDGKTLQKLNYGAFWFVLLIVSGVLAIVQSLLS